MGQVGKEDGLYWFRTNDDISVFHGCGLGGTSLVNANVSLPPERRIWVDPAWPKALRDDVDAGVEEGLGHARAMLKPTPYPDRYPTLKKYAALKESGEAMGEAEKVYHPPLNVTFQTHRNHVGVHQNACTGCGDCVSGCNYGAKNTLMMNYLPDARNRGAEIFCNVAVRRVAKQGDNLCVYYTPIHCDRERFDGPDLFVTCGVVILAAGTLGSTEIMLRSKAAGLRCSEKVGERFSGNGDVLGFGYNNDRRINGIGMGQAVDSADPPGPCITGILDRREQPDLEDGFVIEEGAMPRAVASFVPASLKAAAALTGADTDRGVWDRVKEKFREYVSLLAGAYRGAAHNTQTYLIMSHDDGSGRLELEDDRVRIRWPGLGQDPRFRTLNDTLRSATEATGGTYVPSPQFNELFGYDLVTVHPLGGCCMGEDATGGVVNERGQAFSAPSGSEVYEGLYISDGAIIPRPLGVNPLLTISALAERNVKRLAEDRGWAIDYGFEQGRARYDGTVESEGRRRLRFTERMAGHCSTGSAADFAQAEEEGKRTGSTCSFVLTIVTEDLDRMIDHEDHEAGLVGTVTVPSLSDEAMTTVEGRFNLFVEAGEGEGTKKMRYRMGLQSVEGKQYRFDGHKVIRDDPGAELWDDTTTLYATITEGAAESGPVVARGILRIAPEDFAKQATTITARDSDGNTSLQAAARFGRFFAGTLWDTYGFESWGGAPEGSGR